MPRTSRKAITQQASSSSLVPDALGPRAPSRDRLLELAGYDEAKLAHIVKLAIEKAVEKLSALKVTRYLIPAGGGNAPELVEHVDIDHGSQLRAVSLLAELTGVQTWGKGATPGGPGGQHLHITLAPMPSTSTPQAPQVVVIEQPSAVQPSEK